MLSVELDGAVELRSAMWRFTPDLAQNLDNEIQSALYPIVRKARGFVPSQAPLSGWESASRDKRGRFPWFNGMEVRQGIYSTTESPKANKKGFTYAASIVNSTAAGSIYETAGRKNKNGRKQAPMMKKYTDAGTPNARWQGEWIRSGTKNQSRSNNPNAGKQFIAAMPPLVKADTLKRAGRPSRKSTGRLIFKAWAQDQGRTNGAVLTAIDKTIQEFHARTKSKFIGTTKKAA